MDDELMLAIFFSLTDSFSFSHFLVSAVSEGRLPSPLLSARFSPSPLFLSNISATEPLSFYLDFPDNQLSESFMRHRALHGDYILKVFVFYTNRQLLSMIGSNLFLSTLLPDWLMLPAMSTHRAGSHVEFAISVTPVYWRICFLTALARRFHLSERFVVMAALSPLQPPGQHYPNLS